MKGGGAGGRYRVEVQQGARAFLERAEEWLRRREDAHNLMLSLAYARASRSAVPGEEDRAAAGKRGPAAVGEGTDVLFATVTEEGRLVGCVMRTPPHKLLLTDLPLKAAEVVAERVAQRYDSIPAVLGPEPVARAVARAWTRRRGGSVHPGMAQRIYRLDEVSPPPKVPGALRPARPSELEQAVSWGRAFAEEAGTQFATTPRTVEGWIRRGELFVWEADGAPRSIAVAGGRTPRGVRIGYVYTPPEERRRGFGTNLVASLSQRMLDDGYAFCVLYTDLANPTSNAIYRRVGYEPLMDVRDFEIRATGGGGLSVPRGRGGRVLRLLLPVLAGLLLLHVIATPARGSQPQEITERTLRVGGATVRALCNGPRPQVLLLHDAGSSADGWRSVLRRLEGEDVTACAYDRRGSGASAPAPEHRGWYGLMDEMRQIHAQLDASRGYVLVGHGLGGLYARLFGAGRPTDVAGLVLVDPVHEDLPRRARAGVPDEAWNEWMRSRQRPNADGLVEARLAERARGARLPSIPVTVITPTRRRVPTGWDARFINEAARQVHASILQGVPGGRHVPARGSASAVQSDDPGLVADEIVRVVEARPVGARRPRSTPK